MIKRILDWFARPAIPRPVQVIRLDQDSILVFSVPGRLNMDQLHQARGSLNEAFGVRCVVLDSGMELIGLTNNPVATPKVSA